MNAYAEWLRLAPDPRPLQEGEKWNVFLSYRSVNRSWVLNLYDVLREQGHKVFLDQYELVAGDRLKKRLEDALTTSQAGVLVWSTAAQDSDWVRREYEVMEDLATDRNGFRFVPIRLDETSLPPFAKQRVFLSFATYPDGPNGGELLRLLHAVTGVALSTEAARFANQQDEASKQAMAKIEGAVTNKYPQRLKRLFDEGGLPWETSSVLGCKAASGLISLDHTGEALEMLLALQERFPRAIRPKQLYALACARRGEEGDLETAQDVLGDLYQLGERDPETVGMYGRTWMDRYKKSNDVSDLRQSRDFYAEAFEKAPDDYYTGINAAAKSVFLGEPEDLEKAAAFAKQVEAIVGDKPHPGDYWKTATVGEVLLIQEQYKEAAQLYDAAVAMKRAALGDHRSTWTQAQLLMDKLNPSPEARALIQKSFAHLND